jgi:phthalate 4,5-dioxygenase oxygenase subunit
MDEYRHGGYYYPELIPGEVRSKANVFNDYEIDRVAQKNFSFSGIKSFPLQDIAMMENQWGPMADRTQEHLTSADQYIAYIRRRLLRAAKNMAAGIGPPEPWHPEAYRYHYGFAQAGSREEAVEGAKAEAMSSRLQIVSR